MRSLIILVILTGQYPLISQVDETNNLSELIGEYTYSITLEQPGVQSKCSGLAKVVWINNNTIRSEFSDHDADFVIEYDPLDKIYLLTYVLQPSEEICASITDRPIFSIHQAELQYTPGLGYSYTGSDPESNWNLDVKIRVEEDQFLCLIKVFAGGEKCEHYLTFCRAKS